MPEADAKNYTEDVSLRKVILLFLNSSLFQILLFFGSTKLNFYQETLGVFAMLPDCCL